MARKSTGSNRQHLIAFAAMLGLLVGGIAKTEAASYKFKFTKIAGTAGDFSGFCGPPALNEKGVVAFSARLDAGPSGIFTGAGDGTSPRTIAENSVPCSVFGPPSLSDSGVLAFRFSLVFGQDAIVRTDGSTPTTIAKIGSGGFRTRLGNPSINDSGTVAFFGLDATGSGIFTSDGTTPPTAIAHRVGLFFVPFGDNPSLSDRGAVAFLAEDLTGTGIFRSDGTTPTTIADSSGPFLAFGSSPSINDKGVVAFWARLDDGRHGIFTGPDPGAHKVIATGDTLDDESTVTFLTFGREGLNNAGAVAFVATLADGTRAVYRADPVPSEVRVSLDIKPGGNPNSINLKSQGTVPVAILTTDDFDATTVNPTTVTLAGAHVKLKKNGMPMAAYEDANGDGRVDLVVHVDTQYLHLDESSMVAVLTGQTYDRMAITGSDTVRIMP